MNKIQQSALQRHRFSEFKIIGNTEANWAMTLMFYDPYRSCS